MCMFRSSRRKCFNDTSQVTKITSLVGTSDESLSWEGEEMGDSGFIVMCLNYMKCMFILLTSELSLSPLHSSTTSGIRKVC